MYSTVLHSIRIRRPPARLPRPHARFYRQFSHAGNGSGPAARRPAYAPANGGAVLRSLETLPTPLEARRRYVQMPNVLNPNASRPLRRPLRRFRTTPASAPEPIAPQQQLPVSTGEQLLESSAPNDLSASVPPTGSDPSGGTGSARVLSRSRRAATARRERLWPDAVIPYEIDANFSGAHRTLFRQAMRAWENATCIAFVERDRTRPEHDNHIQFTEKPCGCVDSYRIIPLPFSNYSVAWE